MRPRTVLLLLLFGVLASAIVLTPAASVHAWGNGEGNLSVYGTHDWLVSQAVKLLPATASWLQINVALAATDDPDYTLNKVEANHNYHPEVSSPDTMPSPFPYGSAPDKVRLYFEQTRAAIAAGDYRTASKALGLLSHYYADISNPLHTDNAVYEGFRHNLYEMKVDTLTKTAATNADWVVWDGDTGGVADAEGAALRARTTAALVHPYYRTLITTYTFCGFNSLVRSITQQCLNIGANGLADIIASI